MGIFADARRRELVSRRLCAAVEDVPTYDLKTPLQRAIQLLKRHRDVMFVDTPEVAPISMILTNLAGHAYAGEADVYDAVRGILARMLNYVRAEQPRVPNPTKAMTFTAGGWRPLGGGECLKIPAGVTHGFTVGSGGLLYFFSVQSPPIHREGEEDDYHRVAGTSESPEPG